MTTAASPRYRPLTPDLGYYTSPGTSPANSPRLSSPRMARTVQFAASEGARDAKSDEKEVMRTFNKHVKNCDTCHEVMTSDYPSAPLCSKGHSYVVDMQPYFYCKGGKPYSQIDKKYKGEMTRVFVPSDYRHVVSLFQALSTGYSTKPSSRRPRVILHQPVPSSQSSERRRERPTIIVPIDQYTTTSRTPRNGERYHEDRRSSEPRYRGSLYYEDEQRRHRQEPEVIRIRPERSYFE